MRPLPGMVAIAEYPSRFEADVAAARLHEAGFEATVLADPASEVAPHHMTHRLALLVVRIEAAEVAADLLGLERPDLEAERLDAAFHQRRFADRPGWVRYLTWIVFIAIPGPFIVVGLWLIWIALSAPFP